MNARPNETAEEIAARHKARLAPGAKVTVLPPYAMTPDAWEPVPLKSEEKKKIERRKMMFRAAEKKAGREKKKAVPPSPERQAQRMRNIRPKMAAPITGEELQWLAAVKAGTTKRVAGRVFGWSGAKVYRVEGRLIDAGYSVPGFYGQGATRDQSAAGKVGAAVRWGKPAGLRTDPEHGKE